MRLFGWTRWVLLALVLVLVPASSFAGVFVSVGIAPPMLPVYEQPPCPEPGWMWTPGYWAYGPDGYYWVPGAWAPAPYIGALWTPPWWGWSSGLYVFHPGYWGRHVGYYGGINYGFGYMGVGFVGGLWRGHEFAYNAEVMRVDERRIHSIYHDRGAVEHAIVARDNHVAFTGGPGGIRHEAGAEERLAERDQHLGRTQFQTQHETLARGDRGNYFKNNNGRPSTPAMARPMGGNGGGQPMQTRSKTMTHDDWNGNRGSGSRSNGTPQGQPMVKERTNPGMTNGSARSNAQVYSPGSAHPSPAVRATPQAQQRPVTPARPAVQPQHATPQPHPAAAPQPHGGQGGHEHK